MIRMDKGNINTLSALKRVSELGDIYLTNPYQESSAMNIHNNMFIFPYTIF